ATLVLFNTPKTHIFAWCVYGSIAGAGVGDTNPHDSALPAGKYTVTLTGKTPQPPMGEPKDDGSEG
ncbi:MAG: hypothetical protein VX669_16310, partial [Planctomycetota bacterium]|nr:hypothetical protein [Planctomycetota bacterium]